MVARVRARVLRCWQDVSERCENEYPRRLRGVLVAAWPTAACMASSQLLGKGRAAGSEDSSFLRALGMHDRDSYCVAVVFIRHLVAPRVSLSLTARRAGDFVLETPPS